MALDNFGSALRNVRRFDEAITAHQRALALFTELGDRHREGMALDNFGSALRNVRRFDEAITAHQRAAALFTELGDRHREGMALRNLGIARAGRMKSMWRVLTRKGRRSIANGRLYRPPAFSYRASRSGSAGQPSQATPAATPSSASRTASLAWNIKVGRPDSAAPTATRNATVTFSGSSKPVVRLITALPAIAASLS